MCIPVHFPWLPGYIDATSTILIVLSMTGIFPDRPRIVCVCVCVHECVATLQGQAGSWYSCTWKNIHRAVGTSGMPLFMGGGATHAASCASVCMSHVMALAPQHGTHRGTCPLARLSHHCPQQGVPTCLSTRGEQSWQDARNYII